MSLAKTLLSSGRATEPDGFRFQRTTSIGAEVLSVDHAGSRTAVSSSPSDGWGEELVETVDPRVEVPSFFFADT